MTTIERTGDSSWRIKHAEDSDVVSLLEGFWDETVNYTGVLDTEVVEGEGNDGEDLAACLC